MCMREVCTSCGRRLTLLDLSPPTPHPPHTLTTQKNPKVDDNTKRFALLCVGELGRRADLTAFPTLPDVLTAALASGALATRAGWEGLLRRAGPAPKPLAAGHQPCLSAHASTTAHPLPHPALTPQS